MRLVTTEAAMPRSRAARERLPASATATNVRRFSMASRAAVLAVSAVAVPWSYRRILGLDEREQRSHVLRGGTTLRYVGLEPQARYGESLKHLNQRARAKRPRHRVGGQQRNAVAAQRGDREHELIVGAQPGSH